MLIYMKMLLILLDQIEHMLVFVLIKMGFMGLYNGYYL